MVEEEICELSP